MTAPSLDAAEAVALAWADSPLAPMLRADTARLLTRNLLAAIWLDAIGDEAARTYLEVAKIYHWILTPTVRA